MLCADVVYWAVRSPFEALKLLRQAEAVVAADLHGAASAAQLPWWPTDKQALLLGVQTYPMSVLTYLPLTLVRVGAYRTWRSTQADAQAAGDGLPLADDVAVTVLFATAAALLTAPLEIARTRTLQRWTDDRRAATAAAAAASAAAAATAATASAQAARGAVVAVAVGAAAAAAEQRHGAGSPHVGPGSPHMEAGSPHVGVGPPGARGVDGAPPLAPLAPAAAHPLSSTSVQTISSIFFDELREAAGSRSVRALYGGALARAAWIGLCFGLVTPLRLVAYGWVRDELILALFDGTALGTTRLG